MTGVVGTEVLGMTGIDTVVEETGNVGRVSSADDIELKGDAIEKKKRSLEL